MIKEVFYNSSSFSFDFTVLALKWSGILLLSFLNVRDFVISILSTGEIFQAIVYISLILHMSLY